MVDPSDPSDPPRPPLTGIQAIWLVRFMQQTAHLTPAARDRVMETVARVSAQRAARLEAKAAINRAAGRGAITPTTLWPLPERITQGPDFEAIRKGMATYSPMPEYTVDPPRSRRKPGPSGSK